MVHDAFCCVMLFQTVHWLYLVPLVSVECSGSDGRADIWAHSTDGNVSGNRCESDCRSRGCEFDPGPILSWRLIMSPLNHSRRVVVSYKQKYVHKVLVNYLFKLAQENVW